MGHQFYARLSGAGFEAFRLELEQDVPDRRRAADVGAKAVFYRVVQLVVAGDIKRVFEAVCTALRAPDGSLPVPELSLVAQASVLEKVKRSCKYRDDASLVASELMRDLRILRRDLCKNIADPLRSCLHAAARVAADQIARPEVVYRLPKDGFYGVQELASDLSKRLASRAYKSVARQHRDSADGSSQKKWRAPRALSPRRTQAEIGAQDVS